MASIDKITVKQPEETTAFFNCAITLDRRGQAMRKGVVTTILVAVAAALLVAGCSGEPLSTREKGTLIGGGLGAATGAIIGAAVGAPGAGAAIGGAIGGVGGFAVA